MNKLCVKITNDGVLGNYALLLDGEAAKLKKNRFGNYEAEYQTALSSVRVEVVKYADIGGVFWFITQLFLFLISIFGLFDTRIKNRDMFLSFAIDVEVTGQAELVLRCEKPRDGARAIDFQTPCQTRLVSNIYTRDSGARKIVKGLTAAKIITALLTVGVIALAIVLAVI